MAAALDLSSGRDAFELRAPDAPVVLYATDTLLALPGLGPVGLIAACHVRSLEGYHFRLSEKVGAVRAVAGDLVNSLERCSSQLLREAYVQRPARLGVGQHAG